MDRHSFRQWLEDYGSSWGARDAEAFTQLFTPECCYYWTPFGEPKRGREEIAQAFKTATNTQIGIRFEYDILSVDECRGLAHWRCSFTRETTGRVVNLDGIIMIRSSQNGLCEDFREWWHSDEIR
jgi:ketosteroid isomerase-like protein